MIFINSNIGPLIEPRSSELKKEQHHSLSVLREEFSREEKPKSKINLPGIGEIKKVFFYWWEKFVNLSS